jgi:putative DNA primase/helicase
MLKSMYLNDTEFDVKTHIIAFNDCIYDFNELCYRNIQPTDHITKTTGYCALQKSDKHNKKIIDKFIFSLFENEEIIQYWKNTLSSALIGDCKYQSMFIHTGSGSNGKSLLASLLCNVFGQYFYMCDSDFLTRVSKETNSSLVQCCGKRLIVVSEPESNNGQQLQTEFIKKITGGEKVTCRDLFKSNITFLPQFTVMMLCNDKPALKKTDMSVMRRLKIIDYKFSFVDDPIKQNERKIDREYVKILNNPEIIQEFMYMLIENFKNIQNLNQLVEPDCSIKSKIEYSNESNIVGCYFDNNYFESKEKMFISEMLKDFNENADYNNKMSATAFSLKLKEKIGSNNILITGGYKYVLCSKNIIKSPDQDA